MPFKSKQPEGNGHATQLCIVRQGTLCMHVHCTEGVLVGKDRRSLRNLWVFHTLKCPIV